MNLLHNLLIYTVWFLSTYYVVFLLLVVLTKRGELYEGAPARLRRRPLVSIIVPAYNEQATITATIRSLKRVTYPRVEFIIISDGSTDKTAERALKAIGGDLRFRFIDRKENRNKANTLNEGISLAKGSLIGCMDADATIEPGIIEKVVPRFTHERIGAVTVTVRLKRPQRFLHRIVELEFMIGLSLFLKVLSYFNCVFVTPGPFSIYRKKVLRQIGGFDATNVTEDLEIAYRIHRAGYRIDNTMDAVVTTNAPEGFRGLYIQRRRWYGGALQTLLKHKDMLFSSRYGAFGLFIPFTYLLVASGLIVFASTTYLSASNAIEGLLNLRHLGPDFWHHLFNWEFDLLRIGQTSIVGWTALGMAFITLWAGLRYTRHERYPRTIGILGYPLLFFLYQIWWGGALVTFIRGKKIRWR